MDWNQLKEEAKKMGYEVKKDTVWCRKYFIGELFTLDGITFTEDGTFFWMAKVTLLRTIEHPTKCLP